jgi:hypothetical protein
MMEEERNAAAVTAVSAGILVASIWAMAVIWAAITFFQ